MFEIVCQQPELRLAFAGTIHYRATLIDEGLPTDRDVQKNIGIDQNLQLL